MRQSRLGDLQIKTKERDEVGEGVGGMEGGRVERERERRMHVHAHRHRETDRQTEK